MRRMTDIQGVVRISGHINSDAARAVEPGVGEGDVTIAICTFRRPFVSDAIRSLACQRASTSGFELLIVDNDDTPSAQQNVERTAADAGLIVRYLHCPGRNISVARNACLEACRTAWLAFIDDDEIATSGWLSRLIAAARPDIAAVFGPVRAIYAADAPVWVRTGDFHSVVPVQRGGCIRTGYTCNVLLNLRHPAVAGRRFHWDLGRSGGEDTVFFAEIWGAGGRLGYAADAIVEEKVVQDRETMAWLMRRRFRSGQTIGRLCAVEKGWLGRLALLASAFSKIVFCTVVCLFSIASAVGWRRWLLRLTLHTGVIARLLGIYEWRLYETALTGEPGTAGHAGKPAFGNPDPSS